MSIFFLPLQISSCALPLFWRCKMVKIMKIRLFTLPNVVTLCNLICGSMAAMVALSGEDLRIAFWLIVAAAVCDFLDGMTARLMNSYSGIGVELDSLADMVSFGFAPTAILVALYRLSPSCWTCEGWMVVLGGLLLLTVACGSALRLAKFNVDDTQHDEFEGLPTPAMALFFATLGWLVAGGKVELCREFLVALSLLFAGLMISPIRMFSFKFKSLSWRDNALRYLFIVVALLLLLWLKLGAVALIIPLYVLLSLVRWILNYKRKAE